MAGHRQVCSWPWPPCGLLRFAALTVTRSNYRTTHLSCQGHSLSPHRRPAWDCSCFSSVLPGEWNILSCQATTLSVHTISSYYSACSPYGLSMLCSLSYWQWQWQHCGQLTDMSVVCPAVLKCYTVLLINPLQPSGHYTYCQFNTHKFYMFCMDLRTNSYYFPIQH